MAYAMAQTPVAVQSVGAALTVSAAFGSNVTAGNAIIATPIHYDTSFAVVPAAGVADTRSTSYTQRVEAGGATSTHTAIHHGQVPTSGACTVTYTAANATAFPAIVIHEVSGLTTTPYDVNGSATGTGTPSATTATTTQANELVLAVLAHEGSTNQTLTPGTGYTLGAKQEANSVNTMPIISEHKRVTATGAQVANFAAIASSPFWCLSAATFKEAAAAAGPYPPWPPFQSSVYRM